MSETSHTTVKTEYKDGKKIVTTTTVVTTKVSNVDDDLAVNKSAVVLDSAASVSPTSAVAKDKFQIEALNQHNHYRAQHAVPALKWCSKCESKAQKHADYLAKNNVFAHSADKGFGENLFSSSNSSGANISASDAIDSWYGEIRDMKFGESSPNNFSKVGHFTQIVWKDTTHVGMAYAVRGNSVFVVANYLPPGNIIGKFKQNVFPSKN